MRLAGVLLALLLHLGGTLSSLVEEAQPLCGSGGWGFGCGSLPPGAQLPRGFARVSPDTTPELERIELPFNHFGGYHYADGYVRTFSHVHTSGAGVGDLGLLGVVPSAADPLPTAAAWSRTGARSRFRHEEESARRPGGTASSCGSRPTCWWSWRPPARTLRCTGTRGRTGARGPC